MYTVLYWYMPRYFIRVHYTLSGAHGGVSSSIPSSTRARSRIERVRARSCLTPSQQIIAHLLGGGGACARARTRQYAYYLPTMNTAALYRWNTHNTANTHAITKPHVHSLAHTHTTHVRGREAYARRYARGALILLLIMYTCALAHSLHVCWWSRTRACARVLSHMSLMISHDHASCLLLAV